MSKSKSWIVPNEAGMLDQFDHFTLKLPSYAAKYGLIAAQTTAIRNDYLWLRYAITCTLQFEQEWRNRVIWKNQLKDGPKTTTAALVPGVGSEFVAPRRGGGAGWHAHPLAGSGRVSQGPHGL